MLLEEIWDIPSSHINWKLSVQFKDIYQYITTPISRKENMPYKNTVLSKAKDVLNDIYHLLEERFNWDNYEFYERDIEAVEHMFFQRGQLFAVWRLDTF